MTFHDRLLELVGPDQAGQISSLAELIYTYGYLWVLKHAVSLLH
jgi:hypothetical protein